MQSDELTAHEVALALRLPLRTAQHRIAFWYTHQDDGALPRVRRARVKGEARWCYRVDAQSFGEYRANESDDLVPPCASDEARMLGCTCAILELADGPGAMVAASCPVHGSIVRAS